jgi:hypothetical protein
MAEGLDRTTTMMMAADRWEEMRSKYKNMVESIQCDGSRWRETRRTSNVRDLEADAGDWIRYSRGSA